MVNSAALTTRVLDPELGRLGRVVWVYVLVTVGTLLALGVLSATAPRQAPQEAWVHAVIVAVLAVVLLLRLRVARRGSLRALRAVGLVSALLVLANFVEAGVPHFLPAWMRIESVAVAMLLAGAVWLVVQLRVRLQRSSPS